MRGALQRGVGGAVGAVTDVEKSEEDCNGQVKELAGDLAAKLPGLLETDAAASATLELDEEGAVEPLAALPSPEALRPQTPKPQPRALTLRPSTLNPKP